MLKLEHEAVVRNERLRTVKQILAQLISFFKLAFAKRLMNRNFKKCIYAMTKDYLLGS